MGMYDRVSCFIGNLQGPLGCKKDIIITSDGVLEMGPCQIWEEYPKVRELS